MIPETALPNLLLAALVLPLLSFAVISIGYSLPQFVGIRVAYSTQKFAAYIAIGAIVTGFVLSSVAMFRVWLPAHPLVTTDHPAEAGDHAVGSEDAADHKPSTTTAIRPTTPAIGTRWASSAA